MINVSSEYKDIMNRYIRNRTFISVGIGIINQDAQESGVANGDFEYWSKGSIFNANQSRVEYATLEENYLKADGSMLFVPENNELMQLNYNGITTQDVMGAIRIDFPEVYAIKGITLVFGSAYPTEFEIQTAEKTLSYTNAHESFITNDVLGDTNYIVIKPLSMVGGQQRFRLQSVLMGVGLQYSNEQTKSFNHKDYVSTISEELPSESTNFSFYDEKGLFDVDDNNSFIDYLETMQKITVSFGLELDNGTVEWHQVATNFLKSWKSQKGVVSITATDRLAQMEDEYSLGFRIYTRTAYDEAKSIFQDAGLQPDEYFIDDYLNDVVLTNPMPIGTHKSCLQLLANACRCVIRQNEYGKIMILANFANVLDPDDLKVTTNGHTKWSKPDNILIGSDKVYAELTKDFLKADGKMYFLPENETYLETSYVSEQVADANGKFNKNLLENTATTQTINGVTFTVNDDGSVTANGTATANTGFKLCEEILNVKAGVEYILSGSPKIANCRLDIRKNNTMYKDCQVLTGFGVTVNEVLDGGHGASFIPNEDTTVYAFIRISSGVTLNNVTFYPMLRLASDTDDTYQPYQENPTFTIKLPASYTYFGVNVDFDGNPPSEMVIHTYKSDALVESVKFSKLSKNNSLIHEFSSFDTMVFEFTKGYPLNRVLVNKITFGALSDYVLTQTNMMANPIGYKERRTKNVRVKVFSFQNNEDGEPEEIEDNVFVERVVNLVGENKTLQNPLISTTEHAELLAEWLGNYYGNNISYSVKYRGETRIGASDIIHMESEKKSNLQVEITSNNVSFNGAFSGQIELRQALRMMGG